MYSRCEECTASVRRENFIKLFSIGNKNYQEVVFVIVVKDCGQRENIAPYRSSTPNWILFIGRGRVSTATRSVHLFYFLLLVAQKIITGLRVSTKSLPDFSPCPKTTAMVVNIDYWLVLNVVGHVILSFPAPSLTYIT